MKSILVWTRKDVVTDLLQPFEIICTVINIPQVPLRLIEMRDTKLVTLSKGFVVSEQGLIFSLDILENIIICSKSLSEQVLGRDGKSKYHQRNEVTPN